MIAWSSTSLAGASGGLDYLILTGIDVTEAKRLERTILEISGKQCRIGQDLHDGLGQHLTGVAFMSKVLEQKLREKSLPEAVEAAQVALVNQAVDRTRELSRGLLPVLSDARGLMSALERLALEVEDLFQVGCHFECEPPVLIRESDIATHLYHIAQEAVNNSLKRGPAAARSDSAGGRRRSVPENRGRWRGLSRSVVCHAGSQGDGTADHELPGEDDRRRFGNWTRFGRRDFGPLYVFGEPIWNREVE